MNRGDRDRVVELVRLGRMQPGPASLPRDLRHVSKGGEVIVGFGSERPLVLFYTFRGILDSFAGFVYSADDQPPHEAPFSATWREVVKFDDHWYWVSAH